MNPAPERRRIGARVLLSSLTKAYGEHVAIEDVTLEVGAGELVTILGPSGSGKTTTLMTIAGFVDGYTGEVRIGDRRIDHLPPNRRDIGVVFQHLELFGHMTVADNIAFPLRMRGMARAAVRESVEGALDLVRLSELGGRLPSQLSGGQRQRVALARAVVFSPPLLLLDEPFGALDKQLRAGMQRELRALNERLGITVIHVTHDQVEALAISDRIVVMNRSRVEQIGTPREIYYAPASSFVAEFIGESLLLDGMVVRPECVRLLSASESAERCAEGEVVGSSFAGEQTRYDVELANGRRVVISVPSRRASGPIPRGHRVRLGWDAKDALPIAGGGS